MVRGVHTMFDSGEPDDHGYGLVTEFRAPGDFTIQLYQGAYSRTSPA